MGFRDCFKFHRPPHLKEKPIDYTSFIQVFIAKLLLEVCGAAGAIWGCSEILLLRSVDNNDTWRIVSLTIFGMFLVRFWWHSKHYLEHDREFPPIKMKHRRYHKLSFSQIFSAKLVLEVWGAAGAIWGPSDALKLRTTANTERWRIVSIWVLSLFTIRWILQIMTYCLCFQRRKDHLPTINKCIGWFEMICVRFVLVVLGAIGAVWGFSEILLLRTNTPESNQFWRPIALATGLVFTFRWLLQIFEFGLGLWDDPPPPDDSIRNSSHHRHNSSSNRSTLSLAARLGINKNGDLESSDLQLTESPVLTPPMIVEDES